MSLTKLSLSILANRSYTSPGATEFTDAACALQALACSCACGRCPDLAAESALRYINLQLEHPLPVALQTMCQAMQAHASSWPGSVNIVILLHAL